DTAVHLADRAHRCGDAAAGEADVLVVGREVEDRVIDHIGWRNGRKDTGPARAGGREDDVVADRRNRQRRGGNAGEVRRHGVVLDQARVHPAGDAVEEEPRVAAAEQVVAHVGAATDDHAGDGAARGWRVDTVVFDDVAPRPRAAAGGAGAAEGHAEHS